MFINPLATALDLNLKRTILKVDHTSFSCVGSHQQDFKSKTNMAALGSFYVRLLLFSLEEIHVYSMFYQQECSYFDVCH